MKAFATVRAAVALVLAVLAAAPFGSARAQPPWRPLWRVAERQQARAQARARAQVQPRRPALAAPRPVYAAPTAPPPPAYVPVPPPYAPPPGYGQRPAAAPAPNSLGPGWGQQQDAARRGVRQGALVPLGRVMANIRQGTPGRLLDAGLEPGPDGRPAYRVRWAAANGRRIDFIVDAATGAIIGSSGY